MRKILYRKILLINLVSWALGKDGHYLILGRGPLQCGGQWHKTLWPGAKRSVGKILQILYSVVLPPLRLSSPSSQLKTARGFESTSRCTYSSRCSICVPGVEMGWQGHINPLHAWPEHLLGCHRKST